MYDSAECQAIKDRLISPIQSRNLPLLKHSIATLRETHPLAFSMLADTLRVAEQTLSPSAAMVQPARLQKLIETIAVNIDSLSRWESANNRTISALESGNISPHLLKPHIRLPAEQDDEGFVGQCDRILMNVQSITTKNTLRQSDDINRTLAPNINHAFRMSYATYVVEVLFGLIAEKNTNTIRWLDIGCGVGQVMHTVNPKRYGCKDWEIISCDIRSKIVESANLSQQPGQPLLPKEESGQRLSEMIAENTSYNIVSLFECLTHLSDPLRFLEQLAQFQSGLIVIALPLSQNIDKAFVNKPDPVHLWSFSREGLERLLGMAGLDVIYSAETRVGSYIGGPDWLTVICGDKSLYRFRNFTYLFRRVMTTAPGLRNLHAIYRKTIYNNPK